MGGARRALRRCHVGCGVRKGPAPGQRLLTYTSPARPPARHRSSPSTRSSPTTISAPLRRLPLSLRLADPPLSPLSARASLCPPTPPTHPPALLPGVRTLASPSTMVTASSCARMPALARALAYAWLPCWGMRGCVGMWVWGSV